MDWGLCETAAAGEFILLATDHLVLSIPSSYEFQCAFQIQEESDPQNGGENEPHSFIPGSTTPTREAGGSLGRVSLFRIEHCRPSSSSWAILLHLVPNKDRSWRQCADYRRISAVTRPERYPIRHIKEISASLVGKRIFGKIDVIKVFHQIAEDDILKAAVITPFRLYEFTVMTLDLCNAPHSFQFSDTSWA